jgi:nitroimidazol reductase NimA-like FMN-containing flavoprotein (pyridoxamine 5'-phosphate oxidase superfamily)
MFGTLENNEIEELLSQQLVGRIGCHAADTTYIVPISYAYDGEYIYGHSFEGMKLNMMRENPKVCFQVDNMHNMANWQSVVAWGEFDVNVFE